jgi:hypothetical protein
MVIAKHMLPPFTWQTVSGKLASAFVLRQCMLVALLLVALGNGQDCMIHSEHRLCSVVPPVQQRSVLSSCTVVQSRNRSERQQGHWFLLCIVRPCAQYLDSWLGCTQCRYKKTCGYAHVGFTELTHDPMCCKCTFLCASLCIVHFCSRVQAYFGSTTASIYLFGAYLRSLCVVHAI